MLLPRQMVGDWVIPWLPFVCIVCCGRFNNVGLRAVSYMYMWEQLLERMTLNGSPSAGHFDVPLLEHARLNTTTLVASYVIRKQG